MKSRITTNSKLGTWNTNPLGRLEGIWECGGGSFPTFIGGIINLGRSFGPLSNGLHFKIEAN